MNDVHGFICGEDDDGWDEARCSCGWVGGMAPDIEGAADIWGDHIVHLVASQLKARITELEAELERTRQAWVDGDDPMCEDVCVIACKGPCVGSGATNDQWPSGGHRS